MGERPTITRCGAGSTGSIDVPDNHDLIASDMAPRDTLTADDLATDWHLPPTP